MFLWATCHWPRPTPPDPQEKVQVLGKQQPWLETYKYDSITLTPRPQGIHRIWASLGRNLSSAYYLHYGPANAWYFAPKSLGVHEFAPHPGYQLPDLWTCLRLEETPTAFQSREAGTGRSAIDCPRRLYWQNRRCGRVSHTRRRERNRLSQSRLSICIAVRCVDLPQIQSN